MRKQLSLLSIIFTLMFSLLAHAQDTSKIKYLLPDGQTITADKIDSVKKAWNVERILFEHNKQDDKNHVMHLVRMTPEIAKTLAELAEKSEKSMQEMIGKQAPDFTLKDMSGKTWTLSRLRGKIVILNFWFTACPPCIQEMPQLNDLNKKYTSQDIVFFGLTFNDSEVVKQFLKNHLFNFILLPSSKDVDKRYQVSSWPTTFMIDKSGLVKYAFKTSDNVFADLASMIDKEID